MHAHARLALASLVAAMIMMIMVDGASANRLSVSSTGLRVSWANLTIGEPEVEGATCPLTLEGSFHSATIRKVDGTLIGSITRAAVGTCSAGHFTILNETLSWHITYGGFEGRLPRISGLTVALAGLAIRTEHLGFFCLVTSTAETPLRGTAHLNETTGQITEFRVSQTLPARGGGGGFGCVQTMAQVEGLATVTQLGSTQGINVTLIGGTDPTLSPSPVEFGRLEAEGLARRNVTIRAGTEPTTTINGIRIAIGQYFAITDPNRCVGRSLSSEVSCVFTVVFTAPRETGRSLEDTITVETSMGAFRDTVRGST